MKHIFLGYKTVFNSWHSISESFPYKHTHTHRNLTFIVFWHSPSLKLFISEYSQIIPIGLWVLLLNIVYVRHWLPYTEHLLWLVLCIIPTCPWYSPEALPSRLWREGGSGPGSSSPAGCLLAPSKICLMPPSMCISLSTSVTHLRMGMLCSCMNTSSVCW
jgi:hypothetical protein